MTFGETLVEMIVIMMSLFLVVFGVTGMQWWVFWIDTIRRDQYSWAFFMRIPLIVLFMISFWVGLAIFRFY